MSNHHIIAGSKLILVSFFLLFLPLTSMSDEISYSYDKLNRLKEIKLSDQNISIQYTYDSMNNRLIRQVGANLFDTPDEPTVFNITEPLDLSAVSYEQLKIVWSTNLPNDWVGHFSVYLDEVSPPSLYKSGLRTPELTIGAISSSGPLYLRIESIDLDQAISSSEVTILRPLDTDQDGIPDHIENTQCALFDNPDTDQDGILDGAEADIGTSPCDSDTDGDLVTDDWEVQNGLNPLVNDALSDTDGDGFRNLDEFYAQTDVNSAESKPVGTFVGFEGTVIEPLMWMNDNQEPWQLTAERYSEGFQSLVSGYIANGQASTIKTTVLSIGGLVRFDYKVSTEEKYDFLEFYINGVLQGKWSGENSDFQTVAYALPAGKQVLEWRYKKDGSKAVGADAVWIDNLFVSTQVDSDGDGVEDSWELTYFDSLDVDLTQDSDSDGLTSLQEYANKTDPTDNDSDDDLIPDGWEVQNGLNPLVNDALDDVYGDGQSNFVKYVLANPELTKTQDSDNDLMPDLWEVQNGLNPLVNDALSDTDGDGFRNLDEFYAQTDVNSAESKPVGTFVRFEGTVIEPLMWMNDNQEPWQLTAERYSEGFQSLVSGYIANGQASTIKTTVLSIGGLVRFDYKVSTEEKYDFLEFYINGVLQGKWSGENSDFQTVAYALPAGKQVLEWRYKKDASKAVGADAVWIDNLFVGTQVDSDGDGVEDSWELTYFDSLDVDLTQDSDSDGLTSLQEYANKTDPTDNDSDDDLIPDGWEVQNDLNPLVNDALDDVYGDGQSNFVKYVLANPELTKAQDSDNDLMLDLWEAQNGLNPLVNDALSDTDGDGFRNLDEFYAQTDVNSAESKPVGTFVGFEGTVIEPLMWINDNQEPWQLTAEQYSEGFQSLVSGYIANGQASTIKTTVSSIGGLVRFDYKVSTEEKYDFLEFYINGVLQGKWSGENSDFQTVAYALPAGKQVLEWRYKKDASKAMGADTAWIDNLFVSGGADEDNDGMWDIWESLYGLDNGVVADASEDSDSDGYINLTEYFTTTNPTDATSFPKGINVLFESSNYGSGYFFTSGDTHWFFDSEKAIGGHVSLKSSPLSSNQQVWIETYVKVTKPDFVLFSYSIDSEVCCDKLSFAIDDFEENVWSGQFNNGLFVKKIQPGIHKLTWRYKKDGSIAVGADAVWIDNLYLPADHDADHDQIPDAWELKYFSSLEKDLELDTDGDGVSDLREFQNGTNPIDGADL